MVKCCVRSQQHPLRRLRLCVGGFLVVLTATAGMPIGFDSFLPTVGPLEDAACNVEDLERANDSQLHVILQELKQTAFFRHFVVDLDAKCPLRLWSSKYGGGHSGDGDDDEVDEADDEEFECAGSPLIDEDAPPLCSVEAPEDVSSNALFSLTQGGFKSQDQKEAFSWKQQTDMVVATDEAKEPCDSDLLPDDFWIDMCSMIKTEDKTTTMVNLALNPERNTGYNGTHIWKAIYEENCMFASRNRNEVSRVDPTAAHDRDMCLEERVLYRLLSGLHSSTTLGIAMNYYPPSKRKGRTDWEPNPEYFMQKFKDNPAHIRNLHFSYVVLLRALQKASKYLYQYEIRTGDILQDETAMVLLRRLLDSAILQSCSHVFSAFDESLLFLEDHDNGLKKNFKGVFQNVSSILDCVQCQQCKLHGKLTMLGYGAALKVLFNGKVPELERNEIVAFINTLAKLSESMHHVRELTHLYWQQMQQEKLASAALPSTPTAAPTTESAPTAAPTSTATPSVVNSTSSIAPSIKWVDTAVGAIAALSGRISWEQEADLVKRALARNSDLLILAKHYGTSSDKFLDLLSKTMSITSTTGPDDQQPDAIIVGSGLAGLAAALNILDRGGRVVLVEKEHNLGGNSNKASSGINACCLNETAAPNDSVEVFRNDTLRSAGSSARPDLIDVLVTNSADAVAWLKKRVGVDLSLTSQLGGHSSRRTHRPTNGMVGAEIIYAMTKAVRAYDDRAKIYVDTKVEKLITADGGAVVGVQCRSNQGEVFEVRAPHVILATGGFASDRSQGSYLATYRPELLKLPTTAGLFSTGDGITLAKALGAGTVDMDKVQVHPTGWVDPTNPNNPSKILAAELIRGVGGLLINKEGKRFCNELGTRAYVTEQMLSHDPDYKATGQWNINSEIPTFALVLSNAAAEKAKKHVDFYTHKGLMTRLEGVKALANHMNLTEASVIETLRNYQRSAAKGVDEFGKTTFGGVPEQDLDKEVFFAGTVTPVLHYCMGGITIDKQGNVLDETGKAIPGLHAAGEVTGGVHGVNRLAGNSLLECTVYGTVVGRSIPVRQAAASSSGGPSTAQQVGGAPEEKRDASRKVSMAELQQHNTRDDCWVAIHGTIYDLTDFVDEHPGGARSITDLAGKDGTQAFDAVHNLQLLEDFGDARMGILDISSK